MIPTATPEELADISNGIWMCYKHGKLIDTDEATYTISMLQTWRALAEFKARLRHELGREVESDFAECKNLPLPTGTIEIGSGGVENKLIGDAIHNSCLAEIWGRSVADAIRDAAIELVRNAFLHGGARSVLLVISASSIAIEDDGAPFNSGSLVAASEGGGGLSLRTISDRLRGSVVFSYAHHNSKNISTFILVRTTADLARLSPCAAEITPAEMHAGTSAVRAVRGCDQTFVLLPDYFALSDVLKLPHLLAEAFQDSQRYVLVGSRLSEGVLELIQRVLPGVEILVLG